VLDANVRGGRNELDLVVFRGRTLVFCEVKSKSGERWGDPLDMVDDEKLRRVRRAAGAWLAEHPEHAAARVRIDVVAVRGRRLQRIAVED
jgi:putative endonuclease